MHFGQDIYPMYGVFNGLITVEKLEDSHYKKMIIRYGV